MKGLETSAAQRRIDQQCQQPRLGEIAVTMTKEEFTATDMACAQGEAFRAGVTRADKLERELAALKAQLGGVVLERCAKWCDEQAASDWYGRKASDMVRSFASLNQQPASGGVDERPIAPCLRGQFESWAMETEHPVFGYIGADWLDQGDYPNTYANDYIQGAWVMFQNRAALAQSECVPEGYVLIRHTLLESIWIDADSGAFCNPDKGELAEVRAILDAAAPSPSKQGGE